MVDARRLLLPYRVPTPAGQGAVIPFGLGGVNELAHGAVVTVESGLAGDLEVLAAVVELPEEVHLAGVGVDLAAHLHGFLQRGPDDRYLLQRANRRDWSRVMRGEGKKKEEIKTHILEWGKKKKRNCRKYEIISSPLSIFAEL